MLIPLFVHVILQNVRKETFGQTIELNRTQTINDAGNILPPSSAVYNNISAAILQGGSSINAKHIYTTLKKIAMVYMIMYCVFLT